MNVAIVGAGGLGSYIGAVLCQAGHEVTLVTRGAHRAAIEADGLRVLSHAGDFEVRPRCVGSSEEIESADLAFVVTKTFSLSEIVPGLRHLADRGATIVSLLNGVTARERLLAAGLPDDRVADGVAYMTSFRVAPGVVERRATHQRIVVGEGTAAERVGEAFRDTIVEIESTPDIRVELWEKMAVVCSLSVLCAMAERAMGHLRSHPLGAELQHRAIDEVFTVARARGVPVPEDATARIDETLDRFPDDFFPSVIHDLNGGRRTEMDDLGGAIARMGREAGVPTPLHDVGTLIVELAERRGG